MARFKIISFLLLLVSSSVVVAQTAPNYGTYNADGTSTIYSTTNNYGPLYNLYDLYFADADTNNGVTKCDFSDDGGCNVAAEFGFSWEWHNESFNYGLMSTNGCLKLLTSSSFNANTDYCGDYTPNQLGSNEAGYTATATDTIFPFYTDLIYADEEYTDTGDSAMMFKTFDDYAIFGWYHMAEYGYHDDTNRPPDSDPGDKSSNSFELYIFDYNDSVNKCTTETSKLCTDSERAEVNKPDNYGIIYRELSIEDHDVLIGEQKDPQNYTQYLFYDDNTDNNGDGTVDGNFDMMDNGYLEYGGGILYSEASGEPAQCQNDPLYSNDCILYDLAFTEYQCQQDPQSSEQCTFYQNLDPNQGLTCEMDPMSDPSCPAYQQMTDFLNDPNYDPNTGLVTDPTTGMVYDMNGVVNDNGWVDYDGVPRFDDGYYADMGMENPNDYQDEPWMVNGNYDPRLDPNIRYDDLNTEQQMLVDQGLSPQDAVFVTLGQEHIFALGEDPLAVQFNGHRPGDYVLDVVGGLENYDTQLHDTAMQQQSIEWDPNGNIDMLTADVWATEEFQQEATEQLVGMVETYGEEFYSFTDQDWYEHDVATYGQAEVDQWHENIEFDEEGQINWDTFEPTNYDDYDYEDELREDGFIDMLPDLYEVYDAEEILEDADEAYDILAEDEAFEELISEDELQELIAEEAPEEMREELIEERELIVEEEQKEVREEAIAQEKTVEREAEQAASSSSSSSRSRPSYQSIAISQFVSEVSDDVETADVIEDVIEDGGSSGSTSYGVDSGSDQSFSEQDGGSFSNSGSSSSSSSSTDSSGYVADDSSQQQFEQSTGQVDTAIDVADTSFDAVETSAFEVSESLQEEQTEEQLFIEAFDDGSGGITSADMQFEDNLTEALSSGTGLTEFLSQQAPDFSRFDIQQSGQEIRTSDAVESLADSVGAEVAQANLQATLEGIQDGSSDDGGYADQTIAVAYIGYTAGFSSYTGEQVYSEGSTGFFDNKQMPDGKIDDNKMGFYRMAGNTQEKLYKMVLMQYGIQPDEDTGEQQ